MEREASLPLAPDDAQAVPYFNWDATVTNAEVRSALAAGSEEDKVFWIARILREASYRDVWSWVSLRRDVLPRWDVLRPKLGRQRRFWEFLIDSWQRDELI